MVSREFKRVFVMPVLRFTTYTFVVVHSVLEAQPLVRLILPGADVDLRFNDVNKTTGTSIVLA